MTGTSACADVLALVETASTIIFLNGLLVHGLDFDDTHSESIIHCSASALPMVLAQQRMFRAQMMLLSLALCSLPIIVSCTAFAGLCLKV